MREWLSELKYRLRLLFKRRQLEKDLQEELAFHIAMREESLQRDRERQKISEYFSVLLSYSCLSATTGSTRVALRAGTYAAKTVTMRTMAAVAASVIGWITWISGGR